MKIWYLSNVSAIASVNYKANLCDISCSVAGPSGSSDRQTVCPTVWLAVLAAWLTVLAVRLAVTKLVILFLTFRGNQTLPIECEVRRTEPMLTHVYFSPRRAQPRVGQNMASVQRCAAWITDDYPTLLAIWDPQQGVYNLCVVCRRWDEHWRCAKRSVISARSRLTLGIWLRTVGFPLAKCRR